MWDETMTLYEICSRSSEGMLRTYIHSIDVDNFEFKESCTVAYKNGKMIAVLPADLTILDKDSVEDETVVIDDKEEMEEIRNRIKEIKKMAGSI